VKRFVAVTTFLAILGFGLELSAADLPRIVDSTPCNDPPVIDGKIGVDEWHEAKPIAFELSVLHVKGGAIAKRACELRVMNSANALYVALRVPDPVVNKSIAPLNFDFANLAFCRGIDVAAGDDRKGVAVGVYLDKHVTKPGQDADDQRQDGKGAMAHDAGQGIYTIEWAVPLNCSDKDDLQAKPGDAIRFNLAYIDAFQADLKETQIGTVYPGGLDRATDWGTLNLAADVKDDGGIAFMGPKWIKRMFDGFQSSMPRRLRLVESTLLPGSEGAVAKVLVEYPYRDARGHAATGQAKLYLPATGEPGPAEKPLYYSAGYELDDASAVGHVGRGFVVVTPRSVVVNPLVRTVNPDAALLHIARSLPFINDARVIIAGGSAGGYSTLMLAAETFPLAGAAPDVPPINWGYNAAYILQREHGDNRNGKNPPKTPYFDAVVAIAQQGVKVYGDDTSAEIYFRHSPLGQIDSITCPVSVYWTTADMLVPIDQVGKQWVHPIDATKFPKGFTFDPEQLTATVTGRTRLTDVLQEQDYELFVVPETMIVPKVGGMPVELAVSETRRWSITILDEGPPEPQVGHTKYAVPWSQQKFIAGVLGKKIEVTQLTVVKLQRLMDRYAGREWLPTELVHLDDAESERVDVIRGLKTYTGAGPDHARIFAELYNNLPVERQVLPETVVRELQSVAPDR
jgi:hypothetical protein